VPIVTWPSQTDQPTCILDVWQSDSLGYYDNEGYHLRGGCKASDEGNMTIRTILPGRTIENNDSRRRIHFKVWKSVSPTEARLSIGGHEEELTSCWYFGDNKEELELLDSLFEGRVIHLDENNTGLANIYLDLV
jgi:protocatechuate 3,4-dioxygenase beta subunit